MNELCIPQYWKDMINVVNECQIIVSQRYDDANRAQPLEKSGSEKWQQQCGKRRTIDRGDAGETTGRCCV